jgi:hypothetical protein
VEKRQRKYEKEFPEINLNVILSRHKHLLLNIISIFFHMYIKKMYHFCQNCTLYYIPILKCFHFQNFAFDSIFIQTFLFYLRVYLVISKMRIFYNNPENKPCQLILQRHPLFIWNT